MSLDALTHLGGWSLNTATIERVCTESEVRRFWDALPAQKGASRGKTVMLHQAFHKVVGADQEYRNQTIGNCVGRGGARCGDLLQCLQGNWQAYTLSAGVYGGARVEIGRDEKGSSIRGDGAVVAYAVECMTEIGALLAIKYSDQWDFTGRHDDDKLDKEWGKRGIPDELEPKCIKVEKWYVIESGEEAMDAIASGMPVVFGTSLAHWGRGLPAKRDAKGFLKLTGTTAHCWICTGSIDDGKTTALVFDNRSWGNEWCVGPEGDYPVGNGRYLGRPEDLTKMIHRGEAYALSAFGGGQPAPPDKLDWVTL